ncbi:MAG: mechanosensitive ion channel family protein [Verrucomicrobiales bacterium]|nr:mechanosensitive ion channel family protein [Verrucomicrobiales bacterium]
MSAPGNQDHAAGTERKKWSVVERLAWPLITLALLLLPGWPLLELYGAEARELSQRLVFWTLGTAIGFTIAWFLVRLIDVLVWDVVEHRFRAHVPRLLKDVVVAGVFLATAITILGVVFRRDVTGLWVSSGVLGIIIGFAVRGTIADVFAGIALNVDRPFSVGDWIETHVRGIKVMRGRVVEMNWRSTRIQTIDNTVVVVPNNLLASTVLVNLSLPEPKSRFELAFCLEFGVPAERVLRILNAGALAAKGPLTDPPPKVYVNGVTEIGVEYKVRYWLDPVEVSPRSGRHQVTSSILQHLYHAGISLAYPKQDLYLARMPNRQLSRDADREQLLSRVELFAALRPEEIRRLAAAAQERAVLAGEAVVRQRDPGSSLYVVVEGLLGVYKAAPDAAQAPIHVVELQPGEFFGEMSLLTGAPRAATVIANTDSIIYEIGASEINALLAHRPEIALRMAEIVARRERQLAAACAPSETPAHAEPEGGLVQEILGRMRTFFSSLRDRLHVSPSERDPSDPRSDPPEPPRA